jgi:hypothetical protein
MQNPFETGHIKNYILFYASIVVIMILFFIATTLFHDVKEVETKVFESNNSGNSVKKEPSTAPLEEKPFKLLDKAY